MSLPRQAEPPAERCRRFSTGDGAVMVAAAAVSFTVLRFYLPLVAAAFRGVPFDRLSTASDWWDSLASRPEVAAIAALSASFLLILTLTVASLAHFAVRLRKPRPQFQLLVTQPGFAAVLAVLGGVGLAPAASLIGLHKFVGITCVVFAVPLTWAALAIRGRWRPEAGWIEGVGRAVGVCWCLLLPLHVGLGEILVSRIR